MNKSILPYSILSFLSFYLVYISSNSAFAVFSIIVFIASGVSLLIYLESLFRTRKSDVISLIIFILFNIFIYSLSINNDIVSKLSISLNQKNIQIWWMPLYILLVFLPVFVLYYNRKRSKPLFIPVMVFAAAPALLSGVLLLFFSNFRQHAVDVVSIMIQTGVIDVLEQAKNNNTISMPESYLNILSYLSQYKMLVAKKIVYLMPTFTASMFTLMVYLSDRFKPLIKDNHIVAREFSVPDNLVWLLILGGFAAFIPNEGVNYLSYNILLVLSMLYFFQGIQIINKAMERFRMSLFMRSLFFLFIVFYFYVFVILVVLTGLFSIWYKPQWLTGAKDEKQKSDNDDRDT